MFEVDRCQVVPLADHQASLCVDGREVTRWHFGPSYPRPFFYPLLGPSGVSLTRMGHPGAENHDHHRSVWFAHHKLLGIDFWSDQTEARIRQQRWLVYRDGTEHAQLAVSLGWFDGHDPAPLVEQELIATLRPLADGEYTLELQSTFVPRAGEVEFQQTNFGFLAVRLAKSISAAFGGGRLTGADGGVGEPALFGLPNSWMDYSGPVVVPRGDGGRFVVEEGITYFDHPENPGYPAKWHVRQDGWMGASACRDAGLMASPDRPLRLRYLLYVHRGPVSPERNEVIQAEWLRFPRWGVRKGTQPHHQLELYELT